MNEKSFQRQCGALMARHDVEQLTERGGDRWDAEWEELRAAANADQRRRADELFALHRDNLATEDDA